MSFVFYLSSDCFCGGGGVLTQISTDGVVRFMTDFHGFASAGVSLTDFVDDYLTQISQISQIFLSHRFAVFGAAVGYRSQISQISRIFRGGKVFYGLSVLSV